MIMNLDKLKTLLENADGKTLFGDKGKSHPDYIKYVRICHPDGFTDKLLREQAKTVFQLLEKRVAETNSYITISVGDKKFEIEPSPFAKGDICNLYRTRDNLRILKISRKDKFNKLMQKEKDVLSDIHELSTSVGRSYLPTIEDSIILNIKNFPKRYVNIYGYNPDCITAEYILSREMWKRGIEDRTFCWMFRRLLMSMAVIHATGYIHGAITPDHLLCNKVNHDGCLIDFIHAARIGEVVDTIKKDKRFYPPEILNNKKVDESSDIYMAGKLGIYMLGGCISSKNLPRLIHSKIEGFLRAMCQEKQLARPTDALNLHQDFTDITKRIFGKLQYHELIGV